MEQDLEEIAYTKVCIQQETNTHYIDLTYFFHVACLCLPLKGRESPEIQCSGRKHVIRPELDTGVGYFTC